MTTGSESPASAWKKLPVQEQVILSENINKEALIFPVVECFTSIQGESTHAGRLCFFIRLAGCNLKCSYCDTVYAQDAAVGSSVTLEEILEEARRSPADLVELTGGEPSLHPAAPVLVQALIAEGFEVLMETNGSVRLDKFPPQLKRIMQLCSVSADFHL